MIEETIGILSLIDSHSDWNRHFASSRGVGNFPLDLETIRNVRNNPSREKWKNSNFYFCTDEPSYEHNHHFLPILSQFFWKYVVISKFQG